MSDERNLWCEVFMHFTKTSVANREAVINEAKTRADEAVTAYRAAFPVTVQVVAETAVASKPAQPSAQKGKSEK